MVLVQAVEPVVRQSYGQPVYYGSFAQDLESTTVSAIAYLNGVGKLIYASTAHLRNSETIRVSGGEESRGAGPAGAAQVVPRMPRGLFARFAVQLAFCYNRTGIEN